MGSPKISLFIKPLSENTIIQMLFVTDHSSRGQRRRARWSPEGCVMQRIRLHSPYFATCKNRVVTKLWRAHRMSNVVWGTNSGCIIVLFFVYIFSMGSPSFLSQVFEAEVAALCIEVIQMQVILIIIVTSSRNWYHCSLCWMISLKSWKPMLKK